MSTQVSRVVVRFAGDSGDGMQLTGSRFGAAAARQGNDIVTLPDYPAEIRAPQGSLGGVSSFQVHLADREVHTGGDLADVLVATNPAALKMHLPSLRPGGVVITDTAEYTRRNLTRAGYAANPLDGDDLDTWQVIALDLTRITAEAVKDYRLNRKVVARTRNMFALGLVSWLYSRDLAPTIDWLTRRFADQPNIRDANIAALRAGEYLGDNSELFTHRYQVAPAPAPAGVYRHISGNQAMAIGLITAARLAGLRLFLGAYPITPASDILHELAKRSAWGVQVFQAEDEIAAAGAALGASFGGALGVTTTSGPGFTLKQEMINLAVMTELPLVVVDVQRGGPSTGMPTKAEQSDLLQALWGRNGDSPLPVIAPASPSDCFDAALEACRVAIERRTPVVVLSDAYLANGSQPWLIPRVDALDRIDPGFASKPNSDAGFLPYLRDEQGIRPWAIPGAPGLEHRLGGLEKSWGTGAVSYDPDNHQNMTSARARRIAEIPIPEATLDDPGGRAKVLVIGWGSTEGAIMEATERLRDTGQQIARVHLRWLNPMPPNLGDLLTGYQRIIVPELNCGQLAHELRARYLVDARSFSRVRGLPLSVGELVDQLAEVIKEVDGE